MEHRLTKAELIETMYGQEILSIEWEQCVIVDFRGRILGEGAKALEPNPTLKQLSDLMHELFTQEFGYVSISDLI